MIVWTVAALVAVVLTVWWLEWASRVVLRRRVGNDRRITQALRDRFTGWRNNPAFRRVDIAHNAQGFRRTTSVSLRKAPGSLRCFLLGGSTAYGAQGGFAHIDDRWSRITNDQLIDSSLETRLNLASPSGHAEVINAAVSGYRIHQQLALVQSRLRRYRPDHIVSMDGYNDCISLYNWARGGHRTEFDVYESTPGLEEFDALANPGSLRSLAVFGEAWLRARSSLFSLVLQHAPGRVRNPWGAVRPAERREFTGAVQLADLTADERLAAAAAIESVSYYAATARQIHRMLDLDGVRPAFLLQPILILSHKPFTEMERRFLEYEWKGSGPLYFYLFRELYRLIDQTMTEAAGTEGFRYLNLVDVFDSTEEQVFSDFAHLTPAGNRIIADKLFQSVFGAGDVVST